MSNLNVEAMSKAEKTVVERAKVGRSQVSYAPNNKLMSTLLRENKLWRYPLFGSIFNIIVLFAATFYFKDNFGAFPMIMESLEQLVYSGIYYMFIFAIVPILLRIFYNHIVRKILNNGVMKRTPVRNFLIGVFNTIVNALLVGGVMYFGMVSFILVVSLVFGPEVFASIPLSVELDLSGYEIPPPPPLMELYMLFSYLPFKWQAIIILVILMLMGYALFAIMLAMAIFMNLVRSVMVAVYAFKLLPKDKILSEKFRFTNYHHLDSDTVEELYRITSKVSGEATSGDFIKFSQVRDLNTCRVLMKDWVPIGFYALNDKRDTLMEVKIHRNAHESNFLPAILDDFTENLQKSGKEEGYCQINGRRDSLNTKQLLLDNKWKYDRSEGIMEIYKKRFRTFNH